jgi:hypothetical protein
MLRGRGSHSERIGPRPHRGVRGVARLSGAFGRPLSPRFGSAKRENLVDTFAVRGQRQLAPVQLFLRVFGKTLRNGPRSSPGGRFTLCAGLSSDDA